MVLNSVSVYTSLWFSNCLLLLFLHGLPKPTMSPGRYTGICCLSSGSVTYLHRQSRSCSHRKDGGSGCLSLSGCQHTSALCVSDAGPKGLLECSTWKQWGWKLRSQRLLVWRFSSFLPGVMAESKRRDKHNASCAFMACEYQVATRPSRQRPHEASLCWLVLGKLAAPSNRAVLI